MNSAHMGRLSLRRVHWILNTPSTVERLYEILLSGAPALLLAILLMALALVLAACEGGDMPNLSEGGERAKVKYTSVSAGGFHTCGVITDGAVAC